MNILRAPSDAPWPYGPPGNLTQPAGDLSFRGFVDRLSRFSRDGLLDMGSRVLWYPWQENVQPTADPARIVTETFGPDVIGLAMMFCHPVDGIDAEEVDFRLLGWELFSLASFAASDSVEAEAERLRIAARWDDRLAGTALGRLDARRSADHVRGLWMRGRLLATELLTLPSLTDELPRILLLHDALEAEAPNPSAYRDARRIYFGNEPDRLLRHALGLIGLVSRPARSGSTCPGRFDIFDADAGGEDVVDFAQFGRLACTAASEFGAVGRQLLALPEHERKLSPHARPLTLRPGIVLDDRSDRRAFSFPSPRRLLRSLHRLFIDDFVDFIGAHAELDARIGTPAPSLLGGAVHRHLADAVGQGVIVIEDATCPVVGKKPDAVWCGERYGVVFEAKARVTPRSDPEFASPDSMLEAWRRCWEAVQQATEFVGNDVARRWMTERSGQSPRVWVLAIVVDEDLVAERTSFRHATSTWNRLAGTGLAGLAVVSFGCLEAVVRQQSADGFGRFVERAWLESGADGFAQPSEEPTFATNERPAHLENAFRRLLGDE